MFAFVPRWLPLALIALVGLWLRTHDLARRPMHADEANQAVKTGELLETGHYAFDPRDHHGPTLYYAALPIAWLRGERSLATLTETTVRLVPAIAGTLGVILVGLIAIPYGRRMAVIAAALMAVSPPAVYYSRYFIQETLLVTFTLGAIWCAQQGWRRRSTAWIIAAGACVGLMQATKASAPLFLVAAALGWIIAQRLTCTAKPNSRPSPEPCIRESMPPRSRTAVVFALMTAVLVAGIFYSSFGTHLSGLRDAISVYGPATERATGVSGHEKPWWYYLDLFGWHRDGGLVWQQIVFSISAIIGIVVVVLRRSTFGIGTVVYTAIVLIVLSLTPYKTPWHSVHLVPGLSVLAAMAILSLPRLWAVLLAASFVLWSQTEQTKLAAFLRPADARNPYAYVHSSPDVMKVRAKVESALARSPDGVVRIISKEYWPLPWYLRGVGRVGYWTEVPEEVEGALIIASADLADAVRSRLRGGYHESFLGLRPGYLCIVFTPEP